MARTCGTCAKEATCFHKSGKVVDCTKHEPRLETNWERLFGTPERAAESLGCSCFGARPEACEYCVFEECDGQLRRSGSFVTVKARMLEMLEGEAE